MAPAFFISGIVIFKTVILSVAKNPCALSHTRHCPAFSLRGILARKLDSVGSRRDPGESLRQAQGRLFAALRMTDLFFIIGTMSALLHHAGHQFLFAQQLQFNRSIHRKRIHGQAVMP